MMKSDISPADSGYRPDEPLVLHLAMKSKPVKSLPIQLDYDFVKSFIEKGLRMNDITCTLTEVETENGPLGYLLSDEGLYASWGTPGGVFEGWARNQGAFEAARKEGFTDEQLLKLDLRMGLPVWIELVGPEDVVRFLSGQSFCLYASHRKIIEHKVTSDRTK